MLSKRENEFYSRQLLLSDFGETAQLKLKRSRVLVVGAGGLGCPVLQYIAAAGIGHIGIVDNDKVAWSNLHRQILFNSNDLGKNKARAAKNKLELLNPDIQVQCFEMRLTAQNAKSILYNYDLVVDCTDNLGSRYLINDICLEQNKVFVYGALHKFEGYVSVFNQKLENGERGPNYRDLYPQAPENKALKNCEDNGVIGVLAGMVGLYQANEVIKVVAGIGTPLSGKLLMIDGLKSQTQVITLQKSKLPANLNSADYSIGNSCEALTNENTITGEELRKLISRKQEVQLIDVREFQDEKSIHGSIHIPFSILEQKLDHFSKHAALVLFCSKGIKSQDAVDILVEKHGFTNVRGLSGGIDTFI